MSDDFVLPKKMREDYVTRRHEDFILLKKSFENNSIEEFKRIGHQLAGNAESYGFAELGLIGVKMEALSLADLKNQGPALMTAYKAWLDTVVVE